MHAEREALIADLGQLDETAWATPSLCTGWTVHDVLAHLVNDAKTTPFRFIAQLASARFDFDALNQRGMEAERQEHPRDTLERFRAVAGRSTSAPTPAATRYVEAFVHGEDIRRPSASPARTHARRCSRPSLTSARRPSPWAAARNSLPTAHSSRSMRGPHQTDH